MAGCENPIGGDESAATDPPAARNEATLGMGRVGQVGVGRIGRIVANRDRRPRLDRKDKYGLIPAKMVNKSEDGLFIELDCSLQPGSNISIKMVAPERDQPENPYHMKDGLVIWCKKVDDETSRFGAGVKILRRVVRADILDSRFT